MFREYGELSTMLYEFTKPIGRSIDGDIENYSAELQDVRGRILEAGVGTGRMLIPLLKQGLIVDGLDLSPEMLAQCKLNLEQHGVEAKLYEQDLLQLALPERYEAIVMPTGSFCLLPRDMAATVLCGFYDHLETDGRIIVDLEMPIYFEAGKVSATSFPMENGQGIILSGTNGSIDWLNQKTSSISRYELIEDGEVLKTEISNFTMYWYGVSEFELLLASIGYQDIRREVGYGQGETEIVTFIAYKR